MSLSSEIGSGEVPTEKKNVFQQSIGAEHAASSGHFSHELREKFVSKLMKDVEGTCSGRLGFSVAITGIESVGKGLIRDGTGFVTFPVKYQCVVLRPFKGEILEDVVSMANKRNKDTQWNAFGEGVEGNEAEEKRSLKGFRSLCEVITF